MPELSQPSATVEVTADRQHGLVVRGVTRQMKEAQGVIKDFGLRWSKRQSLWYLPNSRGDEFSLDVETTSRRLAHRITVECGVHVRQLSLVSTEDVQDGATAAGPCPVPAIDPVYARDHPSGGWVGSRYEATVALQPAAITALIRDDVKKAKRQGLLPDKLDVSVVKRSYSGGWSIDIKVKHWVSPYRYVDPVDGRQWIEPAVQNILSNLEAIGTQYNRRHDDAQTDYFSGRFHLSVTMDWETCCQTEVLASPSHPVFSKPAPYQRS